MRHIVALLFVIVGFGGLMLPNVLSAESSLVAILEIDEPILPVTSRFLVRGIEKADEEGAQLIIVTLDTPGGMLDVTRDIVTSIIESPIPVVVYVYPNGSHAASAGTFIAASAHVAAMAPVSNIGAASPVGLGKDLPPTIESKTRQDAAAELRSISEIRGRNTQVLETTVMEAMAYSSSEALEKNIIDIVANNIEDLISKLDGITVCIGGECRVRDGNLEGGELFTINTLNMETFEIRKTVLEKFLGFLANPTVAYLLLALGVIGIFIEFFMGAGLIMPGFAGVICLALSFVAMNQLPVNWVGGGLILIAIILFYLELNIPGSSIFGVTGVIAFALGGLFLFGDFGLPGFATEPIETPGLRVNPFAVIGVTVVTAGTLFFVLKSILGAQRSGTTGRTLSDDLVGQVGVVKVILDPEGVVHVAGEDWSAVSDSEDIIYEGNDVMVSSVDGLKLNVFKSPVRSEDVL